MIAETIESQQSTIAEKEGGNLTGKEFEDRAFEDGAFEEETSAQTAQPEMIRQQVITVPRRDPADIRLIMILSVLGVLLVTVILSLAAIVGYKILSSPPVVVVHSTKDAEGNEVEHVIALDGEMIGEISARSSDRPNDGDKKAAAAKWSGLLYQIDPATRADDLERAIKMMVPNASIELVKQLTPDFELQRRERWQTVWKPQVISIDPIDPYTVRVVGRQEITKIIGGQRKTVTRQLAFNLKVVFDSQKRTERNDRTGFLISDLRDFQIIDENERETTETKTSNEAADAKNKAPEQMPKPGEFKVPEP